MARRKPMLRPDEGVVEINVTSLVDVVFFLLVFFILRSGGLPDTGVSVDLPRAARSEEVARTSLLIGIDAAGRIVHEGRDLNPDGLRGLVSSRQRADPTPVVLVADESTPSGRLIEVLDWCRLAGAPDVQVATRRP
jgi:biopolymer transport protein ExbD